MGSLGAPELLIILILVLLVFGGAKLPKLARSLGRAQSEFKSGLSEAATEADKQGDGASRSTDKDQPGGTSSKNGAH